MTSRCSATTQTVESDRSAREGDGQFNFPTHLAFAADKLYVTDTLNSRVQIFDTDGNMSQNSASAGCLWATWCAQGGGRGQCRQYLRDRILHDNLLIFDSQGRTLLAVGGSGKDAGQFYLPAGFGSTARIRFISPTCSTAESRSCSF